MYYLGFDVHRNFIVVEAINQDGSVVARRKIAANPEAVRAFIRELGEVEMKVAFEASGSYYWVSDTLEEFANVRRVLVNPYKTRIIAEAQMKTDSVDAEILARLVRADCVFESRLLTKEQRSTRDKMRFRMSLVQLRTILKNRVHGILIKHGIENTFTDLFGVKGMEWLVGLDLPGFYDESRDACLRLIDKINEEIALIDKWITKTVRMTKEAANLTTIPGVGKISALVLMSEIGRIAWFKSPRKLSAFAGLAQGIHQSGDKTIIRGLRTDANKYIKWICVEAVTKAVRVVPAWKRLYDNICRNDKSKRAVARAAVAHKIIKAVWRVLSTGEAFDHTAAGNPDGTARQRGLV